MPLLLLLLLLLPLLRLLLRLATMLNYGDENEESTADGEIYDDATDGATTAVAAAGDSKTLLLTDSTATSPSEATTPVHWCVRWM